MVSDIVCDVVRLFSYMVILKLFESSLLQLPLQEPFLLPHQELIEPELFYVLATGKVWHF